MSEVGDKEQEYRDYMESLGKKRVVFQDLFEAVEKEARVSQKVQTLLSKKEPITVVALGSATPDNLDTLRGKLAFRGNPNDRLVIIDIDKRATLEHLARGRKRKGTHVKVYQADMNAVPLPSDSADLVISDMTINYNQTVSENETTVAEMRRISKGNQEGVILFSCVVDAQYDAPQYGEDQDNVPAEKINIPGEFNALPDGSLKRLCWPLPYYRKLLTGAGFAQIIEFDKEEGRCRFSEPGNIVSYRRFCLTKEDRAFEAEP